MFILQKVSVKIGLTLIILTILGFKIVTAKPADPVIPPSKDPCLTRIDLPAC